MRSAILLLLLTCPVWGQRIEAPTTGEPHKLTRCRVSGAESAGWIVLPVGVADYEVSADTLSLVFAAPPGTYTVLAAVVGGGKPSFLAATVTIGTTTDPLPTPNPGPTPTPNPPTPAPAGSLEEAARLYWRAVPDGLALASARVRSGEAKTVAEAQAVIAIPVKQVRTLYGQALDKATDGMFEPDGRIKDRDGYADVLMRASKAMGGGK